MCDKSRRHSVEELSSWQQSFESLRREFHRQGNHDGHRGCEFALEAIRQYQMAAPFTERGPRPESDLLTARAQTALRQFDDHVDMNEFDDISRWWNKYGAPLLDSIDKAAVAPSSAIEATGEKKMKVTDEMVDRFLGWKLPEDFHPDAGISFTPHYNVEYNAKQGLPPAHHNPIGTNLLTATQARAMLEHVLAVRSATLPTALPALPGQKPMTFIMLPPQDMKQADAVIEALKRGDTTFVPTPISELFFHQLRLRVAQDTALADKIAVYYLHEGKWREVGLRYDDTLRWPVGFCQEGWEIEVEISKARSASTDGKDHA